MKLNQKIKAIRENKKLSQSFIAHELGLYQSQYSRRENGEIQFNSDEIIKLSQLLETTISHLFGEQEKKSETQISDRLIEQYELRLKEKDKVIKMLNKKLKSKN